MHVTLQICVFIPKRAVAGNKLYLCTIVLVSRYSLLIADVFLILIKISVVLLQIPSTKIMTLQCMLKQVFWYSWEKAMGWSFTKWIYFLFRLFRTNHSFTFVVVLSPSDPMCVYNCVQGSSEREPCGGEWEGGETGEAGEWRGSCQIIWKAWLWRLTPLKWITLIWQKTLTLTWLTSVRTLRHSLGDSLRRCLLLKWVGYSV